MHNFQSRNKLIRQVGWWSIIINFALFLLKLFAGRSADSVAIVADAWHTLTDSLSPIIILLTALFISKKADKARPHMHGQVEMISSIALGMILLAVGLGFMDRSLHHLFERKEVHYHEHEIVYWAMIISIFFKELLAQYSFYAYRKTKSKMLKAQGWHQRADAISSAIVLAGILLSHYIKGIDAILGIIVSGFILYNAYHIIRDSVKIIIGSKLPPQTITQIKTIAEQQLGANIITKDFILHKYSNQSILNFQIEFPGNYDFEKSTQARQQLSEAIQSELNLKVDIRF